MAKPHIVMINASLSGDAGNTAFVLTRARQLLARRAKVTTITLSATPANRPPPARSSAASSAPGNVPANVNTPELAPPDFASIRADLATADAFVFGTGTHWDSWTSVLQKFLEDATPSEGTKLWLGKPAAILVTEHSVGGKGVLSRLQGVLSTFGCLIPPMSGLVISKSAQLAAKYDADATSDFWSLGDLPIACHNLVEAAAGTNRWRAWKVDRDDFSARWIDKP